MNREGRGVLAPEEAAWLCVDDLGSLLRNRRLSSIELLEASLSRIQRLDPLLNTFVTVTADHAREAAEDADAALARGEYQSPLHGIPVGLKDAIDMATVRCTFGSSILAHRVSPTDAAVVRALRGGGAVIVGKQNLHEFAFGTTGENPHFGDVTNPWDPTRIAGGSSAGTAASIAAGLVPLGVGTDTGGSIRIPAAMCGVVGLKPTYGIVSREGVLPLAWSLDHVGPLARTVLDCFSLLDAMVSRPEPNRRGMPPDGFTRQVRQLADDDLHDRRVGIPRQHFFEGIEPAVETVVRRAIEVLGAQGARLVDVPVPHAVHAQAAATPIMGAEAASWHEAWLQRSPDAYGRDVLLRLRQGSLTRAVDYLKGQKLRTLLQHDFVEAFQRVDVIVSPTVPIVAPVRGRTFEPTGTLGLEPRSVLNRLTVPANLTGFPAITVPCGTAEDLPVGLQVMGPPHGEATVGAVALAYERATSWSRRRPALAA